jgi:hypothetical protein
MLLFYQRMWSWRSFCLARPSCKLRFVFIFSAFCVVCGQCFIYMECVISWLDFKQTEPGFTSVKVISVLPINCNFHKITNTAFCIKYVLGNVQKHVWTSFLFCIMQLNFQLIYMCVAYPAPISVGVYWNYFCLWNKWYDMVLLLCLLNIVPWHFEKVYISVSIINLWIHSRIAP